MQSLRSEMDVFVGLDWGGNSGPGSNPDDAIPYLIFLERYVQQYGISSVLDLGCGDGRLAAATDWSTATYNGLDIKNGFDITECELPEADLVIVKDVLQHWSNEAIKRMLPRLQSFPHVLITNCCDPWKTNEDITTGDARGLDLSAPPFSWPVEEVFRWRGHETKSVVRLLT